MKTVRVFLLIASYMWSGMSMLHATDYWTQTGSMNTARLDFNGVLLGSGKLLACGGTSNLQNTLSSCELYDPSGGTWSYTGTMQTARKSFGMVVLSGGKVLVAGGLYPPFSQETSTAEIYDPSSGSWSSASSMNNARSSFGLVTLSDGTVLAAGGLNTNTAEIYNPSNNTWTLTGSMLTARQDFGLKRLGDGTVLAFGGGDTSSAEIYNPSTSSWSATGGMNSPRSRFGSTILSSSSTQTKVLVAGGYITTVGYLTGAEIYDSSTGVWTTTGSMSTARGYFRMLTLNNGDAFVAGGYNGSGYLTGTEEYVVSSGTWASRASLYNATDRYVMVLFPSGKSLIAGGETPCCSLTYSAIYTPDPPPQPQPTSISFSPSTISPGQCYLTTVGNGSNMTIDIEYKFNDDPVQSVIPFDMLDNNGQAWNCTDSNTAIGAYTAVGIRNTLNVPWVPVSATVTVTGP